jgi:hypothetical protein
LGLPAEARSGSGERWLGLPAEARSGSGERRWVPEVGIEPTRGVNPTGF